MTSHVELGRRTFSAALGRLQPADAKDAFRRAEKRSNGQSKRNKQRNKQRLQSLLRTAGFFRCVICRSERRARAVEAKVRDQKNSCNANRAIQTSYPMSSHKAHPSASLPAHLWSQPCRGPCRPWRCVKVTLCGAILGRSCVKQTVVHCYVSVKHSIATQHARQNNSLL